MEVRGCESSIIRKMGEQTAPAKEEFPRKKPGDLISPKGNKILLYDAAGEACVASLMDGSVDVSWIRDEKRDEKIRDGVSRLIVV